MDTTTFLCKVRLTNILTGEHVGSGKTTLVDPTPRNPSVQKCSINYSCGCRSLGLRKSHSSKRPRIVLNQIVHSRNIHFLELYLTKTWVLAKILHSQFLVCQGRPGVISYAPSLNGYRLCFPFPIQTQSLQYVFSGHANKQNRSTLFIRFC